MLMKPLKELINDILNSSENKELENIKRNPTMIKEITNPTEAQQLAAVRSSSHAIKYIKEPTKSTIHRFKKMIYTTIVILRI